MPQILTLHVLESTRQPADADEELVLNRPTPLLPKHAEGLRAAVGIGEKDDEDPSERVPKTR